MINWNSDFHFLSSFNLQFCYRGRRHSIAFNVRCQFSLMFTRARLHLPIEGLLGNERKKVLVPIFVVPTNWDSINVSKREQTDLIFLIPSSQL